MHLFPSVGISHTGLRETILGQNVPKHQLGPASAYQPENNLLCFPLLSLMLSPSPSCGIFWIKLMLRLMRGKRNKKGKNSSLCDNCVAAPSAAGIPLYWPGLTPLSLHLVQLKKQVLPDLQKTYLGLLRFLLSPMWDTTMSIT